MSQHLQREARFTKDSQVSEDTGDQRDAADARLGMPLLRDVWRSQPDIHDIDHAESLLDQFKDCADQPYEHLYYGPVMGISIPRVSDIYNTATARSEQRSFRLEVVPQPKFIYRTTVTDEDVANLQDPSVRPENLSATSSRGAPEVAESNPPRQRRLVGQVEMRELFVNSQVYQGYKTPQKDSGSGPDRRGPAAKAADARPDKETVRQASPVPQLERPRTRPPDSTATVQSINDSILLEIARISDGALYIRQRHRPGADPHLRRPVLILEQKVPRWPNDDDLPSDHKFSITRQAARQCIVDARAQMMQQVQFGFHLYPTVSTIWAVGMAGRWARFFAFTRHAVPKLDLATAASGQYPDEESVAGVMDKIWCSTLFEYIDKQGYYVDSFKKLCHSAITTAAEEYDDQEPRSMEDVERRHTELRQRMSLE